MAFSKEDEEYFGAVGSFGVPKFDREMNGGIPRGFTIIAFTETGAGAELFGKQFTSPAEESENTLYISTNEGNKEIARVFKKYRWPMDINVRTLGEEYNAAVLERQLAASRYRLEGFQLGDIQRLAMTRFVEDETRDFLTETTNEVMSLKPYFRAVIDSMDFFLQRDEPTRDLDDQDDAGPYPDDPRVVAPDGQRRRDVPRRTTGIGHHRRHGVDLRCPYHRNRIRDLDDDLEVQERSRESEAHRLSSDPRGGTTPETVERIA